MGENRNYAALDWVIGEIGETLTQARQALEAYVEDQNDSTRIRFCLTHIHQVHGSLQMVEFFGAALLAEEMENLIVLPFYPPQYIAHRDWHLIQDLNDKIKQTNRKKNECTSSCIEKVFSGYGTNTKFNHYYLKDGVHPNRELSRRYEDALERWQREREHQCFQRKRSKTD